MRRPINPVIPYPHEAIQHTRCVLALSMITVALSLLKPEMLVQLGDLGRQVEKVDRWIERCSDDVQRRRPEHLPRLLPGSSLAQPAQNADHAVQCARKGRPANRRDWDAGVRAGRVG